MATHKSGIAITIRAFLPTGKTLDEQFAALSAVKAAHESGDYAALLKLATIDDVKTESKTRRVEDAAPAPAGDLVPTPGDDPDFRDVAGTISYSDPKPPAQHEIADELTIDESQIAKDEEVPGFLRRDKGKGKAA